MSNLFAIFLQSLCVKLGTVTGLDLAANSRKHLPRWLTYILNILAESAIIATDIAEVIASVIALNLLLHILFTCRSSIMTIHSDEDGRRMNGQGGRGSEYAKRMVHCCFGGVHLVGDRRD